MKFYSSIFLGVIGFCFSIPAVVAQPRHCAQVVASLPKGHFLENVVATKDGTLFVTDVIGRGVYRYREDDGLRLLATLPQAPVGIELTPNGLVVSVLPITPGSEGRIVELSLTGEIVDSFAIPGSRFLNGITALGDGQYLVAESALGQIIAFDPATNSSRTWLASSHLAVANRDKAQPGVNGLKRVGNKLWITNSQKATLLSLRLNDPSPENIVVEAAGVVLDDIAVDSDGTIYATTHTERLLRLTPAMNVQEFANSAEHLFGITAAAIVENAEQKALYVIGDGGLYEGKELQPASIVRLTLKAPDIPCAPSPTLTSKSPPPRS